MIKKLKYVEVVLTTYCTLKCSKCSNYINLYQKPYHIALEKIILSMDKLLSIVDRIETVGLLGGEPFLYPKLNDVIGYLCDKKQIDEIRIVTNGTIELKNYSLVRQMMNDKVYVQINGYPNSKEKALELYEMLKKENVRSMYVDRTVERWKQYNPNPLTKPHEHALKEQFDNCKMMCRSILNGKLFFCPRSAHGDDLKIFKENRFVNLLSPISDDELLCQINDLFYSGEYLEACKYCNAGTIEFIDINAGI